jgi:hypothetical protein
MNISVYWFIQGLIVLSTVQTQTYLGRDSVLWEGAGMACQIDGIMNGDLYIKILDDELRESLEYCGKTTEDIIFQQDNNSKHTSKKVKKWLAEHDYEVMLWPSKYTDVNPIEHLWSLLKMKLKSYPEEPKGIQKLWKRV